MNILFILGAGASRDITWQSNNIPLFPTGPELIQQVLKNSFLTEYQSLNQTERLSLVGKAPTNSIKAAYIKEICQFTKSEPQAILFLHAHLSKTKLQSLDFFIDEFREFESLVKFLIAESIWKCENNFYQAMKSNRLNPCWYDHLFQDGVLSPDSLKQHKIRFITFNYDRSLELYLQNYFPYTYKNSLKDGSVSNILKNIEIIHIHGCLGKIDFDNSAYPLNPGNPKEDATFYGSMSKSIKTIHEGNSDKEFMACSKVIMDSNKVYVLGFGFNPENTEKLFANPFPDSTIGTAYGHSEKEIEKFNAIAYNHFSYKNGENTNANVKLYNTTIRKLFTDYHPIFERDSDFSLYSLQNHGPQ